MKKCFKCKELFPISDFPKDCTKKLGVKSYCFPCNRKIVNKSTRGRVEQRKIENKINQKQIKEYSSKYQKSNLEYFRDYAREYLKVPKRRLIHNTRVRIYKALKNNLKTSSSTELLGCSIEEYKEYIENQFDDKMNWDNYGSYWEIDHTIPINKGGSFNHKNTTPMVVKENREKSDKILKEKL